ncbi:MAG: hypothetical protein PHR45_03550 [Muribaculaceae bacterium]|nr:hypothetical protein [Muribaculaceae bacterium]
MKLDYTLRRERDRELYADIKKTCECWVRSNRRFTKRELIEYVLTTGKPRYHIGFEYALRVISEILRNKAPLKKTTLNRAMWSEIIDKVKQMQTKHKNMSFSDALCEVLAFERATRYYITTDYAKLIIHRMNEDTAHNHLRA